MNVKAAAIRTARRAAVVALGTLAASGTAAANSFTDATPASVISWTVPAGVTEIRVTAEGGSGGLSSTGLAGGSGATASGVFTVVPGQVVTYIIGAQGGTGTANDGGGGGSTGVFVNGTLMIVAGGGAGYDNTQGAAGAQGGRNTNNGQNGVAASGCLAAPGGTAGNGGGGGNQLNDPCGTVVPDKDGGAGGGGFASAGQNAAGGAGGGGQGNAATPTVAAGGVTITDSVGTGANGGAGFSGGGASEPREAGAGGGYSGGGGANSGGRPGGGGSFVRPGTAAATLTAGPISTNNGNGSVTIEWSTLTLVKQVTNDDGGTALPAAFTLRVSSTFGDQTGATAYANGNVVNITSNLTSNTYSASEDAFAGYTLASNSCTSLVHTLAAIGTDYTCTIVNNDNPVTINALPETFAPVLGTTGGTTTTVLGSDTLNGAPIANPALVAVTVTGATGGLTLNGSNQIVVPAGLAPGPYTLTYQVCEIASPGNCDTQTETVTVLGIDAVAETFPAVPSGTGGTTTTVLASDTLNGAPIANPALVAVTVTGATGGLTLNGSNQIVVPAGLAAGPYTLTYQICEVANPTNCDTVTETVTVVAIDAVAETFSQVSSATGGTTTSILASDTLNGAPIANPAQVAVTVTGATGGLTLNGSNQIIVPAGLAAGPYTLTYQICEVANPTNCDTVTETVTVGAIDAVAETFPNINAATGGTTTSILASDTLNGAPIANPALITLSVTGSTGGLALNASNQIVVPAGLAAGPYTLTYQICEVANPTNCDTVTETVTVGTIDAVAETFPAVNSATGGTTTSILASDTLNGAPIANPALVTVTVTGATGGLTLNGANQIVVPAGLAAGPYTLTYQICEVANPTFCDTVTETVTVSGILAVDDAPVAIPGGAGGATPTVLGNDTLNGAPATPATVTITPGVAPAPAAGSITMNPATGIITVAAGTTPGTYLYPYTICSIADPAICSTATATVVVAANVIAAVNDSFGPITPTGGTTPSVLVNDTINGVAVVPANITLAPGLAPTPAAGSITMNPDGTITIAPGTTPGTYSYPYTICEVAVPANCATAIATVTVGAASGAALVTDISRGNAPGTAVTVSVITNDSDPLGVFNPATLQIVGTAGPGLPLVVAGQGTWSVNLANGTITFTPAPGFTGNPTPVPYQIRDLAGSLIAPALVIVLYESAPVFVCSEVIGKVFEDPNFNGRQDAGEDGMPGVRLATVNGRIITTDEHGRYHVPCAMLPKDTGSNFLLKVDPRSLPSGFRFTTENPRVVRLSQGMMSRMNFGVALSELVEVDLSAAAFGTGSGGVSAALDDALDMLADRIADTPSVVRLNYHLKGEARQVARARLDAVEDALREHWQGRGRYKLVVEQTIVRPK